MFRYVLYLSLTILFLGCVPKSQYDALVVERDFYRKKTIDQDSLAADRIRSVTDSITIGQYDERERIGRIEDLTATNRILQQDLTQLRERYRALADADLTTPVAADSDSRLMIQQLERELGQLLGRALSSGYAISTPQPTELRVALNYDRLLTDDLSAVSGDGENILRRLSATLRNYPKLHYVVLSRGEGGMGAPAKSYRQTIDRSIVVADKMAELGFNPSRMTVATRGRYGTAGTNDTEERPAKPVIELVITYGD